MKVTELGNQLPSPEGLPLPNTPATSTPGISTNESNLNVAAPALNGGVLSPSEGLGQEEVKEKLPEDSRKRPSPDEGEVHEEEGKKEQSADETRGRWAPDEHKRFLDALHKFGNLWAKVAHYVGTRTPRQTRSHAQKYFRKLRLQELQKIRQDPARANYLFVITREYRNRIPAPEYVIELPVDESPRLKPVSQPRLPSLNSVSIPPPQQAPENAVPIPAPAPVSMPYQPMTPMFNPYFGMPYWVVPQAPFPYPGLLRPAFPSPFY